MDTRRFGRRDSTVLAGELERGRQGPLLKTVFRLAPTSTSPQPIRVSGRLTPW